MAFTYEDALAALNDAERFGVNPSLDTIAALCEALGRPQDSFTSIQVAGTNGKTSVTWLAEAILTARGVSAAAYTSPHLHEYTERMRIGGIDCSPEEFTSAVDAVLKAAKDAGIDAPTEFEILTAAALWLFREREVEVAVLEVGMGGRWDATSIVSPRAAVVTGVGLDHSEHLGETREEIATEKACIIEEGAAVVLGPGVNGVEEVFAARAAETGTIITQVGTDVIVEHDFELAAHMPSYQAVNMAMARAAVEGVLGDPVSAADVSTALSQVRLPARFEVVAEKPLTVVDGSHNPQAATVLGGAIQERFDELPTVVLAVLDDKDAAGIMNALRPVIRSIVVTRSSSPRSVEPSALAAIITEQVGVTPRTYDSLEEALSALEEDTPEGLVVTGSLTIAAEARAALLGK